MKRRNFLAGALVAAALGIGAMGATPAFASPEHPVIGFSIDDLRVERWARDRDYFIAAAEKLGQRSTSSRLTATKKSRSSRSKT